MCYSVIGRMDGGLPRRALRNTERFEAVYLLIPTLEPRISWSAIGWRRADEQTTLARRRSASDMNYRRYGARRIDGGSTSVFTGDRGLKCCM